MSHEIVRLLLVEDDPKRRDFFSALLPQGFRMVWARTAGAALNIVNQDLPDTYAGVLLDYDMPEAGSSGTNAERVALRIAERFSKDTEILVHSTNSSGAPRMTVLLTGAGFSVLRIPFGSMTKKKFSAWIDRLEQPSLPESPCSTERRASR